MFISGTNIWGGNYYGAISSTPAVVTDPYFNYVSLLLPGDGSNGAQNNTFVDSSTNNFTITRAGNPTQGTLSPYSPAGWSNYFDGSGDYLTVPDSAAFDFSSGNFTIECWVYPTSQPATVYFAGQTASGGYAPVLLYFSSGRPGVAVSSDGTSWAINGYTTNAITLNVWTHLALVRNGNKWSIYVNGVENVIAASTSVTPYNSSNALTIGIETAVTLNYPYFGYISNLRIVKGTAVYTTNFTPPTAPLTAISGTSLLTCQSNRFVDNSTNNFAITVAGDTRVTNSAPFAPEDSYSASANGGSAYFDGTGDYLSAPDNAALEFDGNDFTIECWIFPTSIGTNMVIFDQRISGTTANAFVIYIDTSGKPNYYTFTPTTASISFNLTLTKNSWNHVVFQRKTNILYCYLNGTVASNTLDVSYLNNAGDFNNRLFAGFDGSSALIGYASNLRIVKGTAVYTSNFTPPTTPLTAISGTSLLLNATNAGITDAATRNVIETVGDAKISTAQSKFGGSSMYFDGTGDWLTLPTFSVLQMGSADFTWECWFYPQSLPSSGQYRTLWAQRSTTAAIGGPAVVFDSSGNYLLFISNANASGWGLSGSDSGLDVTVNSWQHIALVKKDGVYTLYKDGTGGTSFTYAAVVGTSGNTSIGAGAADGAQSIQGYISDLRITRGLARYTANFTPPTAAFPTK